MVYRGIYLPSLSGRLHDERLEAAYQKYAHRQRQRSLMLVNSADLCLKIVIVLKVLCVIDSSEVEDNEIDGNGGGDSGKLVDKTCYLVRVCLCVYCGRGNLILRQWA